MYTLLGVGHGKDQDPDHPSPGLGGKANPDDLWLHPPLHKILSLREKLAIVPTPPPETQLRAFV